MILRPAVPSYRVGNGPGRERGDRGDQVVGRNLGEPFEHPGEIGEVEQPVSGDPEHRGVAHGQARAPRENSITTTAEHGNHQRALHTRSEFAISPFVSLQ